MIIISLIITHNFLDSSRIRQSEFLQDLRKHKINVLIDRNFELTTTLFDHQHTIFRKE